MLDIKNKAFCKTRKYGFTIVELLVVIVVVGILAAIVLVAYNGVQNQAAAATLKSDLKNASTMLEIDKTTDEIYPSSESEANSGKGLPKSSDTTYQYNRTDDGDDDYSDESYCLTATSSKTKSAFHISSTTGGAIQEGACAGHMGYTEWSQISVGGLHTCALDTSGKVYCWGDNGFGQIGDGTTNNSDTPIRVDLSGLSNNKITLISAGGNNTCAVDTSGNAYCWGSGYGDKIAARNHTLANIKNTEIADSYGAIASSNDRYTGLPELIDNTGALNNGSIKSISVGSNHTCAIASDDKAYCWGNNYNGQLGWGALGDSYKTPIAVDTSDQLNNKTIKSLSASGDHTCVIASDNKAYCWGSNSFGQNGIVSGSVNQTPIAVDTSGVLNNKTLSFISSSAFHTCTVDNDGKAYCWGNNYWGQLGNGTRTDSDTPVAVDISGDLNSKSIKYIMAGDNNTCATSTEDKTYCWGPKYSYYTNTDDTAILKPMIISTNNSLPIRSLSSGEGYTCAMLSNKQYQCWQPFWDLNPQDQ